MRTGLLALICAALLLGGASGPSSTAASSGAGHDSALLDAPAIADKLLEANPALSGEEARRIGDAVVRYGEKYRLDPSLVTAVLLVESGARPWARSPKGALGLMQVMPHMLRPLGLVGNPSTIETNIEAGCIILAGNIQRLGEEDGISAYFWGSQIRGVSYLNRVQAAREKVRREIRS
jgi:soluble lytic murein transglycosylase-like protein